MKLSDAMALYRVTAQTEGRSPKTVKAVLASVRYFRDLLGEDVEVEKVTSYDVRRFIAALQSKKVNSNHPLNPTQNRLLSPESIASYVRCFRSFFSTLQREEVIKRSPALKTKPPKCPRKSMPCFTEKEVIALLNQPDKHSPLGFRDYCVMLLMLDSAARLSEITSIKLSDVDFNEGTIRVMRKGGKEQYLPLGSKVAKELIKYRLKYRPDGTGSDAFFVNRNGTPLKPGRVEKVIRAYGRKAGVKTRPSPHTFRATSAVMWVRNGGDSLVLQRKLGHTTLTMTRRYCEVADITVKESHKKYSPVDRLRF